MAQEENCHAHQTMYCTTNYTEVFMAHTDGPGAVKCLQCIIWQQQGK